MNRLMICHGLSIPCQAIIVQMLLHCTLSQIYVLTIVWRNPIHWFLRNILLKTGSHPFRELLSGPTSLQRRRRFLRIMRRGMKPEFLVWWTTLRNIFWCNERRWTRSHILLKPWYSWLRLWRKCVMRLVMKLISVQNNSWPWQFLPMFWMLMWLRLLFRWQKWKNKFHNSRSKKLRRHMQVRWTPSGLIYHVICIGYT